jgi:hypothetical protein
MTSSIGEFIAGAATSAVSGLGSFPAALVVRPIASPATATRPGNTTPASDLVLVKIELNFNR